MKKICLSIIPALWLVSCIGTDYVDEVMVPEEVSIVASVDSLKVGESFQFVADYFNDFGQKEDVLVQWSSSDANVLSIDNSGLATALTPGDVLIRASFGSAADTVMLNSGAVTSVVENERSGVFMGRSDYSVEGPFVLRDLDDKLELTFESGFRASNGPGLFVYLSNEITSVTGGIELGALKSNSGMQTYDIDKSLAQLDSYRYVLIYCKPFGVTFGYGEFSN